MQVVQAPVFHGYTLSVLTDLANDANEEQVRRCLDGGVVEAAIGTQPSNTAVTETGEVLISLSTEPGNERSYWLWIAGDNLRFAARAAVAAAMELAALRPGTRVQ